jgi:hypothetical protein
MKYKKYILFLILNIISMICHQISNAQPYQINLVWSANREPQVSRYNIYRDNQPGTMVILDTILHPDTLYTDSQLNVGDIYFYKVTAVDDQGNESGPSNEVMGSVGEIPGIGLGPIVTSIVAPDYPEMRIQQGCEFILTVRIDLSQQLPPRVQLGQCSGMLTYPTDGNLFLNRIIDSSPNYNGTTQINRETGTITFNGTFAESSPIVIDLFKIEFTAVGSNPSEVNLDVNTLLSIRNSENVLPITELHHVTVTPTSEDILLGDVNADGLVNSTDVLIGMAAEIGLEVSDFFQRRISAGIADVNQDGHTNSTDYLIMSAYDVGINIPMPIERKFCF